MRTDESVERPLHGLRVIEFEAIGPGPLAGRMLSGLGAYVTVVARPTISPVDRELIGENTENELRKGKEIITLDLKAADGVIAALDLIGHADVLIEGDGALRTWTGRVRDPQSAPRLRANDGVGTERTLSAGCRP